MASFRYAQFCPLARAAEILGHRWVLLILRELLLGPQRFTDLRRRLPGVSSSVLAERLGVLESHGVVVRRELPPPAASAVYELTPDGHALRTALLALARWGARFLLPPRAGDHVEPDWMRLVAEIFARPGPTPARRFELRVEGPGGSVRMRFAGGPGGTRLVEDDLPVDARIEAPVMAALGLMSGLLSPEEAVGGGAVRVAGSCEALSELPALFEMDLPTTTTKGTAP